VVVVVVVVSFSYDAIGFVSVILLMTMRSPSLT
jgi:hypothetical protein